MRWPTTYDWLVLRTIHMTRSVNMWFQLFFASDLISKHTPYINIWIKSLSINWDDTFLWQHNNSLLMKLPLLQSFSCWSKTWHLAQRHTALPCSTRRKEGAAAPCACAQGCFSRSPSLKVSGATGVSLSLTGDQLGERRTITASLAVIQPPHISMTCSQRSRWSCLLLFAGQRYWSVSFLKKKNCMSFSYESIFFTDSFCMSRSL